MTNLEKNQNPLLAESAHKNQAVPFPTIQPQHYLPALDATIAEAKQRIETIKANSESASFSNTIEALESAAEDLENVASTFFSMTSAHTNDEMQKLAQQIGPKLSAFQSDISLDQQLFARVEAVWKQKDTLNLNREQSQLLENTYVQFVRNGSALSEEKRQKLREIDERLSQLSPQFSENVLKATNSFEMYIENKQDLKGLPESALEAAAAAAEERGQKGKWLFTLHAPSFIPFLKYAENRSLREKLWTATGSRCCSGEYSNNDVILEIVNLRYQRAQLLGFKTHAEYVLSRRMAESPDRVMEFLNKLLAASKPAAEKEVQEVADFAQQLDGLSDLQPWDFAYYSEKLKEKKFEFSEEELRPYFKLENVVKGAFLHAEKLYNLNFKLVEEYPKYHEDVNVYEVYDKSSNNFIGLFYTDFFPRDSKRSGAWMTDFRGQGQFKGEERRPHVSIVCNFTKPTSSKPSLLTFMEVKTLFHEFGHSLHGLLSQCHYRSLAGTNVYWDFVELPSQIMENWTLEKEGLDLFAEHYETGEKIPQKLADKVKAAARFQAGYASLRQLNFGFLDMAWHNQDPSKIKSVDSFEEQATKNTSVFDKKTGMNSSSSFSHIFAGGYSAGYYSYKWAEVLDADAFEYFLEEGLFNEKVAKAFKASILSRGGTDHPMNLYKEFRGREPDPEALLRRTGLIQ